MAGSVDRVIMTLFNYNPFAKRAFSLRAPGQSQVIPERARAIDGGRWLDM